MYFIFLDILLNALAFYDHLSYELLLRLRHLNVAVTFKESNFRHTLYIFSHVHYTCILFSHRLVCYILKPRRYAPFEKVAM